jgi:cephalosporin hydroxylase
MSRFEDDKTFEARKKENIARMAGDDAFARSSADWFRRSVEHRYSYNFRWLGLPIIQYPADIAAMQELVWAVRPGTIVETGVARGGSLVFYASLMQLLGGDGKVIGVEIALGDENRKLIMSHPMAGRIDIVDGSSTDPGVAAQVKAKAQGHGPVLVVLDSHHGHEHVLNELRLYAPLVGKGSYVVVFDTVVEDLPGGLFDGRPWGPGDNPKTAVQAFLKENGRFEIDRSFNDKLQLSVCPDGFLRCTAD